MKQMLKEETNDILADGRERVKKRQIKRLERKNYDVWQSRSLIRFRSPAVKRNASKLYRLRLWSFFIFQPKVYCVVR